MIFTRLVLILCLLSGVVISHAASTESVVAATPHAEMKEAVLSIFNRDIMTFRGAVLGIEPVDRVTRAQKRIEQQLSLPGVHKASELAMPPGILIQIDGAGSFYVSPDDVDKYEQESLESVAKNAVTNLNQAIVETQESRNFESLLYSFTYAVIASIIYIGLVWLVFYIRRVVEQRFISFANAKLDSLNVVHARLIHRERVQWVLRRLFQTLLWCAVFMLSYEWLSLLMVQFPYTRPWGEQLNSYLFGLVSMLGGAFLKAIPDLFVAFVIFFLARLFIRGLNYIFERIQNGSLQVSWLDADLVGPTRRIANIAVWLFALAMAYPYLPGANTEAFKGVSVLVGLMISLGASSLIGQAASGLILTYSRVFRKGEFIHVLEHEGTITEIGMFTTRVRNGMGVELSLPNSLILANVTKNYSRAVKGDGFVVDTQVTIGYDTPWRQVHAMLIEAALRTPGVLSSPAPKVFQTALSDFYPEYLLVCQAVLTEPRPRAEVINQLHENVQDVFNEYGVQIMSPHYLGDPAAAKIVAKEDWDRAPAGQSPLPK
jgi:small-conductance mechanosensitive channel